MQNNLQETLELLADYSHDLRELNIQGHTIKLNLENYQERLKRLNKKDDDPEKNLIFLQEFSNFATRRYQGQLESVYEFFSPGLTLIESLIKNTEGTIAIQQARNERQLNQTVGIASIGLATSQIASAVILATDKPKSDFTFTDRASAFTVSLGIGILAAAIVFMFFHKYARK